MPDESPIVAKLCDVRKGDLYIRKLATGKWTNPAHATRDHNSDGCDAAVILERHHPWPDSRLIRIISGWDHGEMIAEGVLALRSQSGAYYTSDGRNLYDSPRVVIEEWENLMIVNAPTLGVVPPVTPNLDGAGNDSHENYVSTLWDAMKEALLK